MNADEARRLRQDPPAELRAFIAAREDFDGKLEGSNPLAAQGLREFRRHTHWDRDGIPMSLMEWSTFANNDYKRVAEDTIGPCWVSTVWMGIDYSFGSGPPLIFETMIFRADSDGRPHCWEEPFDFQYRYCTETEALAGHAKVVEVLTTALATPSLTAGDVRALLEASL